VKASDICSLTLSEIVVVNELPKKSMSACEFVSIVVEVSEVM
jgi:hypothetical protein